MILPENNSVIVIDDDPNQAMPIIKSLSKKGLSTIYYRGFKQEELPDKPLNNIRLVIADLQLLSTDNDGHTIATRLINLLQKLLSPDNGPYMLLIWSLKNHLFGSDFMNEIKKKDNKLSPICISTLDKSKCIVRKDNNESKEIIERILKDIKTRFAVDDMEVIEKSLYDNWPNEEVFEETPNSIDLIEENLKTELVKAGVFHLFIIWENLIRKAGAQTVNTISSTIEYTDIWENNMRDVLKRMGQARTGQNTLSNDLFLKAALTTFSGSFSEELEYEIRKLDFPEYIKLESPFSIAGKLNEDIYKIILYQDGQHRKVKLLKNEELYKGKNNIKPEKILSLSEGLEEPEKQLIVELVKRYQEIPLIINTKLHLELEPLEGHIPGNVYKIVVSQEKKRELLTSYFDKIPEDISDYHFVELEVSPICDYAQKKWKKSRLLSGLVYPASGVNIKPGPFYVNSPQIIIDNKRFFLVFNYLLFKSLDVCDVEKRGKSWFRIKRELLQDIIAGLSGHVNRPGITTVM